MAPIGEIGTSPGLASITAPSDDFYYQHLSAGHAVDEDFAASLTSASLNFDDVGTPDPPVSALLAARAHESLVLPIHASYNFTY